MFPGRRLRSNPLDILWRHALGYTPDFLNQVGGPVGWVRWGHRAVQYLDQLEIPKKQKYAVLSPKFELRVNRSFEQVVRCCASARVSWISPELIAGLLQLHRMGYAHSFETWSGGELAGGYFGIQLGGLVTIHSGFHRVSNAGRAAFGRAMLLLRDRGFKFVDVATVPKHMVNFGSVWIPQWKFEAEIRQVIQQRPTITDGVVCPPVPWPIRWGFPAVRIARSLHRHWPEGTSGR